MADAYWIRGQAYEAARHFDKAIADYTKTLKLDPEAFVVYHSRGRAHFKSGHVDDSIADFDKHNKHSPSYEPYDWQRGISYYYAGQYAKGVRQFEIHKTVNPQDVENAVWHYLCKTRIDGVEKAPRRADRDYGRSAEVGTAGLPDVPGQNGTSGGAGQEQRRRRVRRVAVLFSSLRRSLSRSCRQGRPRAQTYRARR